tara:strand:+ start:175 stop:552 length:378 start_codon:yes stop_codon:yes gene_type:complete
LSIPGKGHKKYPYNPELGHRPQQSGLVHGHHLYPARRNSCVSDGSHGLVESLCDQLEAKQQHGRGFCVQCRQEALEAERVPEISNTELGIQFAGEAFTGTLNRHRIKISIDGKGRVLGKVMTERL